MIAHGFHQHKIPKIKSICQLSRPLLSTPLRQFVISISVSFNNSESTGIYLSAGNAWNYCGYYDRPRVITDTSKIFASLWLTHPFAIHNSSKQRISCCYERCSYTLWNASHVQVTFKIKIPVRCSLNQNKRKLPSQVIPKSTRSAFRWTFQIDFTIKHAPALLPGIGYFPWVFGYVLLKPSTLALKACYRRRNEHLVKY